MKVDISQVLSCLVFFVTGWCLIRQILRKVYKGHWAIYSWSFFLGAFGFSVMEMARAFDVILPYALKIRSASLGLFLFSFAAVLIFCSLESPRKNQLRPLTRLPLIGILLAPMVPFPKLGLMIVVTEALFSFYALKKGDKMRYAFRAQIKASLMAPLALISPTWGIAFWALWSFSFKNAAVNAAIVKGKMLDYDESFNEN